MNLSGEPQTSMNLIQLCWKQSLGHLVTWVTRVDQHCHFELALSVDTLHLEQEGTAVWMLGLGNMPHDCPPARQCACHSHSDNQVALLY